MNFFQHQQQARTSTRRLVGLFVLAVLSLVVITNLLVMFLFGFLGSGEQQALTFDRVLAQFDWQVFLVIGGAVVAVITMGSLYKVAQLSSGGDAVAEMLGGRLLVHGSGNLNNEKVLNVVEEMAIASGTPVPPVYLIEEQGINAFAAGFSPSDAVIGITRGATEALDREQLQGVIAHEFSHILNGDMRLNIRLIGILHGILVLGIIGYYLMRSGGYSRRKEGAGLAMLGLGLLVIGYAGTFFGNLIKAAVSRQREYLADASAVQFTRNPDGISGALINIGASQYGSFMDNPETSEVSHCLFGAGMSSFFSGMFATHPPLDDRIKRIKPNWDGNYVANTPKHLREDAEGVEDKLSETEQKKRVVAAATAAVMVGAEQLEVTGEPGNAHLGAAIAIIDSLPTAYTQAVHDPYGARAVIYALLIDEDEQVRRHQLGFLEQRADTGVHAQVVKLLDASDELRVEARLPLIELALPSLRQLSKAQYELFIDNLVKIIEMDGKISLFEWLLHKIVLHHLQRVFGGKHRERYIAANKLDAETGLLLTFVACLDNKDDAAQRAAFARAARQLPGREIELWSVGAITYTALNSALDRLAQLVPLDKQALMQACAEAITADDRVSHKEAELYRALAEVLDCPVPPLLAD